MHCWNWNHGVLLVLLGVKSQTIVAFKYKYTLKGSLACQGNAHRNSLQVNNSNSIYSSPVTASSCQSCSASRAWFQFVKHKHSHINLQKETCIAPIVWASLSGIENNFDKILALNSCADLKHWATYKGNFYSVLVVPVEVQESDNKRQ